MRLISNVLDICAVWYFGCKCMGVGHLYSAGVSGSIGHTRYTIECGKA